MKNLLQRFSALFLLAALVAACREDDTPLPEPANSIEVEQMAYKAPQLPDCGGLPPCVAAVAEEQERLIRLGGEQCGTLISAVPCCESGQPMMIMMKYANPCESRRAPIVNFTGAVPLEGNVLGLEIVREECFAGGTSLHAVFRDTGYPLPIGPFLFHWWIDGQYMGTDPRLECAEGETAWLLVLHVWEGQKYFFEIPLYSTLESF